MKKVIIFLSVLSVLLFGYAACRESATPAPAQSQPPAVVYSTNTPGDDSTVLMYEPLLFGDPMYFALK